MGKEENVGGGKCLFSSYITHIPSRKNSTHSSPLQNLTVALSSAEIDGGRKPSSCSPTVGSPSPAWWVALRRRTRHRGRRIT
ncbi:unnamed protein product [Linum tenue]|uniref:Uncharacterized protein n=1 Tax=Linum tenue TaxID=586396 RepID=A0AAV0NMU3_9ROSI|nr:unnamed protein product [Linum tenue]